MAKDAQPQEAMGNPADNSPPQVRLLARQTPPDSEFADGVWGITAGRGVFKLDLYNVVEFDAKNNIENRQVSHRLVLPLSAVSELMQVLQGFTNAVQQKNTADGPPATGN